jgi:cytochrome c oxidase subunit 2
MSALFHSASAIGPRVDRLALVLLGFSALVTVVVFGLVIFFVCRYRKSRHPVAKPPKMSLPWELSWMAAFTIVGIGFFAWGATLYIRMHVIPTGAVEVYGVGKQWMWKFQHPSGRRELDALHVPVGTPIRLILVSEDVIHSFFVPAFRIKQDVLPGRYTELTFTATRAGEYRFFCAQYCGLSHASMLGKVVALEPARFAQWLRGGSGSERAFGGPTLASRGARHFTKYGCISCHGGTGEGTGVRAPDLAGVFGSTVGLRTGARVFADEAYLRESITEPNAKIVEGYPAIMPSFRNEIPEIELNELVEYVKSLKKEIR